MFVTLQMILYPMSVIEVLKRSLTFYREILNKFHDDVKLLGITFDNELKFDFRFNVLKICSKASRKFSVLAEIQNF